MITQKKNLNHIPKEKKEQERIKERERERDTKQGS